MNKSDIIAILAGDANYPVRLTNRLGKDTPSSISTIGSVGLLYQPLLGLVCSVRCPGASILEAYETAKKVARSEWVVISGFHSPMEKECLRILLRAKHPVVICMARSLDNMRIPVEWREHIEASRMLLLSTYTESIRRNTKKMAEIRNLAVAALAERIWMPHAAPAGKTEALVPRVMSWGIVVDKTVPDFCPPIL